MRSTAVSPLSRIIAAVAADFAPLRRGSIVAAILLTRGAELWAATPQTWNPTTEFSVANGNPNGAWSYGWMDTGFTTFTPYTAHGTNNWYGWGGDQSPAVWLNTTGSTAFGTPPGGLAIHPGNGNEPSVLRWTAPLTTTVRVAGQFLAGDTGSMQVAVRHNNTVRFSATDAGAFDFTINVTGGDTIDFAVYGGYISGNTGLQATIAETAANDAFAGRTTISGTSGSVAGTNSSGTKESSEPSHAGNAGGASSWWTWTAPKTGVVSVSTIGSNFDTLLGVYTGSAVGSLTTFASDDNSGASNTSKLTFNATAGTAYHIAVDGSAGATGSITLNVDYAYHFITFAGTAGSAGATNATGAAARFNFPFGLTFDTAGNLVVADYTNNSVRKISSAGAVTTFAAGLGTTDAVVFDSSGNLFVAGHSANVIYKINSAGVVSTFATGFNFPHGLAIDLSNNLYVANAGTGTIIKLTPAGAASTFASGFNIPTGIAIDSAGYVYVADQGNHAVRKVTPNGATVTVLAGQIGSLGSADGAGSAARFNFPTHARFDSAGDLFVTDRDNQTIRKITPAGVVTTIGGLAPTQGTADGTGSAARFFSPHGLAFDSGGALYVADLGNHTIRKGVPAYAPEVNSVSPSAVVAGGTVTITGANFTAATGVTFNGVAATSFTVVSPTSITATAPTGLTAGNITVTGPGGTSTITAAFTVGVPAPHAQDRFDPNANGTIYATVVQPDGKIIIAGSFTTLTPNLAASPTTATRIARLNRDGSIDSTFTASADQTVYALALQPSDGKILIGGSFTTVNGGTARNRIARLNTNGTPDTAFNPNANGTVNAIAVQSDGKILLGGGFGTLNPNHAGSAVRTNFARLLTDGTLDSLNITLTTGEYGVRALLSLPDGSILVSGDVSTVNSLSRPYIFRITAAGTLDAALPATPVGLVSNLARQIDGKILLGGEFPSLGSVTGTSLARLNADFSVDTGFNPAVDYSVKAIVPQADGKIVVGGIFTAVNGQTRQRLARINPDGSLDPGFVANASSDVLALALQPDGSLVVAGDFTTLATHGRGRIARVLPDGSLERALIADASPSVVGAFAVQPDGKIILGGHFTTLAGQARNTVARLNADSTLDSTFNPAPDASVVAPVVLPNGQFLIGGRFNNIAGQSRPGLARFNANGTFDSAFNANIAGGILNSVLLQPDGKIVIGGTFTSVGGQSRNRLARLNADGTLDITFNPDVSDEVYGLALQADGAIVFSGSFTTVSSVTRNRVARVSAAGAVDSFNPNADGQVSLVVVQPDGSIVVSGVFASIAGTARAGVARLTSGGAIDSAFNPATAGATGIYQAQSDGKLLATGSFTGANGIAASSTARLNADGTIDTSFSPAVVGASGAFAVQPDGKTIIGGDFTSAGGQARLRLARLTSTGPTSQVITATPSTVTFTRTGPLPELAWVTFEKSNDGATDWTTLGTATRIGTTANWQLTGQALPTGALLYLRARGAAPTGVYGASSLVEHVQQLFLAPVVNINSFTPATIADGTTITIFGSGFTAATGVLFNSTAATSFTKVSDNEITAVVPTLASGGSVSVSITSPAGSSVAGTTGTYVVAPTITTHPTPVSATSGSGSPSFTVVAAGTSLSYQWRKLGVPISGANGATLNLTGATLASAGVYDVVVTESGVASVTSAPALLSVAPTAYPGALVLDDTFDLSFERELFDVSSFGVNRVAVLPNSGGKWLAAGSFVRVNNAARMRLARFNADGSLDPTWVPAPISSEVNTVLVLPDGKILIGGTFTRVGHVTRVGLARLNADGSVDPSFANASAGVVYALAVQADGNILVGGSFSNVGFGATRNGLARYNADGTFDSSFDAALGGTSVSVRALVLQTHAGVEKILVGGTFDTAGGVTRRNFARVGATGALDTGFANDAGNGTNLPVAAIIPADSGGKILLGGTFTTYNGQAAPGLARLEAADGALDAAFASAVGTGVGGNNVQALALQADGRILVGGFFTSFNGLARTHLARLSAAGVLDTDFAPTFNASVVSLAAQAATDGGGLVVAGMFTTFNANTNARLARITSLGARDAAVSHTFYRTGSVNALAYTQFGGVLVGGDFTHVGGEPANALVRLNASGALDTAFNSAGSGFPAGAIVNALANLGDGRTYALGFFSSYNGTARNSILRLDFSGALDSAFDPGSGANQTPNALLALPGGKLLLSGFFTSFNGTPRNGIVCLNANGTVDSAFSNPSGTMPGNNLVLVRQFDGKILIGGDFTTYAGASANRLVRLNTDGSLDTAFSTAVGTGPSHVITALVPLSDGRIVAAGGFTSWGGNSAYRFLTRLNSSGSLDTGFTPPAASTGSPGFGVSSLLLQADGRLLERGLIGLGISNTFGFGRFTANGAADATFGMHGVETVNSNDRPMLLLDQGQLLVGGHATMALGGSALRNGLARLVPYAAPAITTPPIGQIANVGGAATLSVTASGGALNNYQWLRNGHAVPGATSSTLALTNLTTADAGSYTVSVSNTLGSVTSIPVTIASADSAPTITLHPQNTTGTAGGSATFTVTIDGGGIPPAAGPSASVAPVAYQWHRNGFPIANATGETLVLNNLTMSDADYYGVSIFRNLSGVTSDLARLSVAPVVYPGALKADAALDLSLENNRNGNVTVIASAGGTDVFVAGEFVRLGGTVARRLARYDASGNLDATFAANLGVGFSGNVSAVVALPAGEGGKILVGGTFLGVNGASRSRLLRLESTGAFDPAFNPSGFGPSGQVHAIARLAADRIVIGGQFTAYNGTTINRIACLDANGALVSTDVFNPGTGFNGTVTSIVVQGGKLLVGGSFTTYNGVSANGLVRLETSGALEASATFDPGTGFDGPVNALVVQPDNRIVVGGSFTTYKGVAAPRIVRLESNGAREATGTFDVGTGFNNSVNTIALDGSGNLIVGGTFTTYKGGSNIGTLVRLTSSGAFDTAFVPAVNGSVHSAYAHADGTVFAGGSFFSVGGDSQRSLTRLAGANGARVTAFSPEVRGPGTAYALVPVAGGKTLIAGSFSHIGGTAAGNLARLDATLAVDASFNTGGAGASSSVTAATLLGDGRIVIAGDFLNYNGTSISRLARLLANGALDSSFTPGTGPFGGTINAVASLPGGRLFVAGSISGYQGVTRGGLVRVHAHGALDPDFSAGTGGLTINALAVASDGRPIIGGNFTAINGTPRGHFARLEQNGAVDTAFANGGGANSQVRALALHPDGRTWLGGDFTAFDGSAANRLARATNFLGGRDTTFAIGDGPNFSVNGFHLQADGRALVAGSFGSFGGQPGTGFLTRVNASGSLDPTFRVVGFTNQTAFGSTSVLEFGDGSVLLGATEFIVSGQQRFGLVRLKPVDPASIQSVVPASARIGQSITVGGTGFAGVRGVRIGETFVSTFTVNSPTQITLTVPAGATTNRISIETENGTVVSAAPLAVAPDFRLRNPVGAYAFFDSIAYGNGVYVAVGFPGEILSSTNGADWTVRYDARPQTTGLRAATHANGLFVAVGDSGLILTSPDGSVWTRRYTSSFGSLQGVAHGNGKFVAVSATSAGGLVTSADGETWTSVASGGPASANGLAFGGGTFVAVGTGGAVSVSTDGLSWSSVTSPTANTLNEVTFVNGLFFAVGNNGTILTSSTGATATWTLATVPATFNTATLYGAATDGLKFVVAGFGTVLTSLDAVTWSGRSDNALDVRSLLFANGQFVAGGSPGCLFTSPDAETWTLRNAITRRTFNDVIHGNGRFVAVGSNATAAVSENSATWTALPVVSGARWTGNDIAYGQGLFALVGSGGLFVSADGTTWTNRTPANFGFSANGIAFGDGRFVTLANDGATFRSSDGQNWTAGGSAGSGTFNTIAHGNGVFVVVGNAGAAARSTDGASWTAHPTGSANNLVGLHYANGQFVAVGANSSVYTSTDGTGWVQRSIPNLPGISLLDVAFGDGLWVATPQGSGSNLFVSSDNAVTWSPLNLGSHVFNPGSSSPMGITFGNGRFAIAGAFGVLLSTEPAPDTLQIITQPVAGTFTPGSAVTLTAGVTGPASGIAFQWYQGFSGDTSNPVSGANAAAFTTPPVNASARYWLRATAGSQVADSATVELLAAPTIALQPQSITTSEFATVTFAVGAFGRAPLSYQWQFNTVDLPGATTATLVISPAGAPRAGSYRVVVTNADGNTTSNAATLTLTPVGPALLNPVATNFGSVLQSHSSASVVANVTGTPPLTFQWKKNGTNIPGASGTVVGYAPFGGLAPIEFFVPDWQAYSNAGYSIELTNAHGSVLGGGPVFVAEEAAWTPHLPLPTPDALSSALVIDDQFVVTGIRGSRFHAAGVGSFSPLPTLSSNNSFAHVIGNGLHLLNGSLGNYSTSTDGHTWTTRHHGFGPQFANVVEFGGGVFALGLTNGRILTSPDAVTWTERDFGNTDTLTGLAFGNGVFVATTAQTLASKVYTSADGASWTQVGDVSNEGTRVRFLNGAFLRFGANGFLATSTNGTAWTSRSTGTTDFISDIAFGAGRYVAVTSSGGIRTATDVALWTAGTSGTTLPLTRVAFAAGQFMAVGGAPSAVPVVLVSSDGTNWNNLATVLTADHFNAAATDGANIVAVGSNGLVARSSGGFYWDVGAADGITARYTDIAHRTGAFVAVGTGGLIRRSTNGGFNWTTIAAPTTNALHFVGNVGAQLIAVGDSGTVLKSTDAGDTWTSVTSGTTTPLNGAAFGAGKYVVVGNNGIIRTSTDLSSWSSTASPTTAHLNEVTFGNGQFVAVGGNGVILSSTDGNTWEQRGLGLPEALTWVGYDGAGFVATGPAGAVFVSRDGFEWTARYTGISNQPGRFNEALRYHNRRFAFGPLGSIASGALDPIIVQQPIGATVSAGQTARLRVIAEGAATAVEYQWLKDGVPVPDANHATLTIANAQAVHAGHYSVVVITDFGTETSHPVMLNVEAPALIAAAPAHATGIPGQPLTLSVNATGTAPLSFQWLLGGDPIPGAHGPTHTISSFSAVHAGDYSVRVSNSFGSPVTSGVAQVTAAAPNSTWRIDPGFARPQFRDTIVPGRATFSPAENKIYVTFNLAELTGMSHERVGAVVRLNLDGTRDPSFNPGAALATAWAVAVASSGSEIYVGGAAAGEYADSGDPVYRVFRLSSTGALDPSYRSPSFSDLPRFITVQPDGKVLAAVSNNSGDGIDTIARLNFDGTVDTTFRIPEFDEPFGVILAPIVLDGSGRILIGGTFTRVNGVLRPNLARLNADGTLDPSFVPTGFVSNGNASQVRGIALQSQGANAGKILVAGGSFTISGANRPVFRLNANGSLDTSFTLTTQADAGMSARPRLLNLVSATDDRFTIVGGSITRFNADGTFDNTFTRVALSAESFWMETLADGSVLAPVERGTTINGTAASGLVRFSAAGTRDTTFAPTFQHEVYGNRIAAQSDSRVLFGGVFNTVNGAARPALARFDTRGGLDTFALPAIPNLLGLEGMFLRSDGRLLAGVVTGANAGSANPIAPQLFNADGSANSAYVFDAATAAALNESDGTAQMLPDDRVLASSQNAQRVLNGSAFLARINADGTRDTTYSGFGDTNFGAVYRGATNQVTQVVAGAFELIGHYPDGRALAVATTGAHPQNATTLNVTLLRLTTTGAIDPGFTAPVLAAPTVTNNFTALTDPVTTSAVTPVIVEIRGLPFRQAIVLADNRIIVGGEFNSLGGHATTQLARLTAEGAIDPTFSTGTGPALRHHPGRQPRITNFTVAADGKIWVTGVFDTFNGHAAPGLVRLNVNGGVDTTFATDAAYRSYLDGDSRVLFAADGSVYLAGSYARAGEAFPFALTRLIVPVGPTIDVMPVLAQSVTVGGALTFGVTATGSPAPTFQWQRNGEDVPGATNASITITGATQANAGVYRVVVTTPFTSVTSDPITVAVITSDLVVMSSRSRVPVGGSTSGSFTIEGAQPKTVLIRGVGPALSSLEVSGFLADPRVRVYDRNNVEVGANNDWRTGANPAGVAPVLATGSQDAALQLTLAPGTYHVVLDGNSGGGGIALLQVYDLERSKPRIVMLTTRGKVGVGGDTVVVGFTLDGTLSKKILFRAPGEQLTNDGFPATSGILVDSMLRVFDSAGSLVAFNDDWSAENSELIAAAAAVGAPPFNGHTLDAAILVDLAPGNYTAELVGFGSSTGEGLIEIFEVDAQRAVAAPPALTWAPSHQRGLVGGDAIFSAHAIGLPVATYQWRRNGLDLAGATNPVLHLINLQDSDAVSGGVPVIYEVVATNTAGSVTSPGRTLTLLPEFHSADSNRDRRINLFELTRVIEIYNYRVGTVRTGAYRSQPGSEDGFMPGPGAITSHHSADSNRDGTIDLTELTRVIELFNYASNNERTGEYHAEVGTEDGFASGPFFIGNFE